MPSLPGAKFTRCRVYRMPSSLFSVPSSPGAGFTRCRVVSIHLRKIHAIITIDIFYQCTSSNGLTNAHYSLKFLLATTLLWSIWWSSGFLVAYVKGPRNLCIKIFCQVNICLCIQGICVRTAFIFDISKWYGC